MKLVKKIKSSRIFNKKVNQWLLCREKRFSDKWDCIFFYIYKAFFNGLLAIIIKKEKKDSLVLMTTFLQTVDLRHRTVQRECVENREGDFSGHPHCYGM